MLVINCPVSSRDSTLIGLSKRPEAIASAVRVAPRNGATMAPAISQHRPTTSATSAAPITVRILVKPIASAWMSSAYTPITSTQFHCGYSAA